MKTKEFILDAILIPLALAILIGLAISIFWNEPERLTQGTYNHTVVPLPDSQDSVNDSFEFYLD